MSAQIQAVTALVLLAIAALAVVLWAMRRPGVEPVTEWPAAPAPQVDFAAELRAIDVPAPANYRSGEWPVVEPRRAAIEDDDPAEPVEVEPEPQAEPAEPTEIEAPWWTLPPAAIYHEPTPLFSAGRAYPSCDVDLSATNSWNRAELLAQIRRAEAEQAGVEAA
jgi:hypothetical protein